MFAILALKRLKQEDFQEFKVSLGYCLSSRRVWATEWEPVSKQTEIKGTWQLSVNLRLDPRIKGALMRQLDTVKAQMSVNNWAVVTQYVFVHLSERSMKLLYNERYLKKKCFKNQLYMFMSACGCAVLCIGTREDRRRGIGSLGSGITGTCDLPDVGARTWIWSTALVVWTLSHSVIPALRVENFHGRLKADFKL